MPSIFLCSLWLFAASRLLADHFRPVLTSSFARLTLGYRDSFRIMSARTFVAYSTPQILKIVEVIALLTGCIVLKASVQVERQATSSGVCTPSDLGLLLRWMASRRSACATGDVEAYQIGSTTPCTFLGSQSCRFA